MAAQRCSVLRFLGDGDEARAKHRAPNPSVAFDGEVDANEDAETIRAEMKQLWRSQRAAGHWKPFGDGLSFLHEAFHTSAFLWPLMEAVRMLLLTGFLALVRPGSMIQIFCGEVVAVSFLVLQVWNRT